MLALCFTACLPKPPPGDEAMGTYAMTATGGERGFVSEDGGDPGLFPDGGPRVCELDEVTAADFEFPATLTRESTSSRAWLTLNGYSREGTFDGQVLSSEASASRVFVACAKCSTRVVETISVAVLSRSQFKAAGDQCPADALVGGVAAPDDDAGIHLPGQTLQGYDAVRLCGEVKTLVVADGLGDGGACDAKCSGCTVRYQLRGDRR